MEIKKFLKIFIFIMIIFLTPNVFATETNVSSKIKYSTDYTGGTYNGDEIALGGTSGPYIVGTRYNGRLSMLSFYISSNDYDFLINHTYSITLNMATQDWRNHFMGPQVLKVNSDGSFISTNGSLSVSNFRFVSYKQIKFNFTTNNSISPYYFFRLYSSDYASNNTIAITGDNNWALSSVIINDQVSTSGSGSSGSSGSGSSINNNTLTCNDGLTITSTTYNDSNINITGSYINSSGNLVSNVGYNVINYIPIKPNTNYQIKKTTSTGDVPSYCLSTNTNSYGSCTAYNTHNTFTFNSGSNSYLSLSIRPEETIYLSYCASSIEIDNQNTQNIIDNANQNTTDIIDNANQNTQQIIDSNKVCNFYDKNSTIENGYLSSSGSIGTVSTSYGVTDFISISQNSVITLKANLSQSLYQCFYNINKEKISCIIVSSLNEGDSINIPSGSSYVRFSINKVSNRPQFEICTNGNQSISNSISDSNVDSGVGSDFFDGFQDNSHGLTSIITAPLNAIQSITSSTCQPLSVPIPFTNSNVSLPCMSQVYQDNIPTIYNIWKIVSFGIIAYFICIDIFHIVKGFKDPESDKVEVLDL